MELVIKNGTIVTALDTFEADLGIADGKIVQIGKNLPKVGKVIDAKGCYVCPGSVEIHTHIDAPMHGSRTADDWHTGTISAACGGVTTVIDYPNQVPGHSLREIIDEWKKRAGEKSVIDYSFAPAIQEITPSVWEEIPKLIEEGYPNFKVFMTYAWRKGDYEITRLLDTLKALGGLLSIHCENGWAIDYLIEKALKEGKTSPFYHEATRPDVMEEETSMRVSLLAEMLDAPVYIVHMSSGKALQRVQEIKGRGGMIYVETTPHFLVFTKDVYTKEPMEAAKFVCTPPFRQISDIDALWKGIRNGSVSTVGSDHCAFFLKAKAVGLDDFPHIPHGAPGIETRVPIVFSEGVSKGRISVNKFVEVMCTNPAKLFGCYPEKGTIRIGSDADIMIIDPNKEVTMTRGLLHSQADYTPYEGMKLKGYPIVTISRGDVLWQGGKFTGKAGRGNWIYRKKFSRLLD
jgi:dihydropyrimidinase